MNSNQPVKSSGLRTAVTQHPVVTFLTVALPLVVLVLTVPALAQYDVLPGRTLPGRVGLTMEEAASFFLVLVIFGTALAVTAVAEGTVGVRILFRRMTRWRVAVRWWLFAVLAMPATTVLLATLMGDRVTVPSPSVLGGEAVAFTVAFLVANLGEEGTWAGFMQAHLERNHAFLTAAVVTAVPFSLVHLPLRVITGEATTVGELAVSFVVLFVFTSFFRALMGAVARGAANSVLLAAVTHTFFNRSNNSGGLVDDFLTGPNRQVAALAAAVVLTVTLSLLIRRRLTRAYRTELDAAEHITQSTPVPHARSPR
jgi:membrane protease YdiL (CAAX protease family)